MVLLFADTQIEDEDTYRFLTDSAADIGAPLVVIADGRDPWQVMHDVRIIGNTRVDPCSRILKRELLRRWIFEHCNPVNCELVIGFTWDELDRMPTLNIRYLPYKVIYPLVFPAITTHAQTFELCSARGLTPPRAYGQGFTHNNCGGFCIKAGQAHFANLLRVNRPLYLHHEAQEQELRTVVGEYSILRDRRSGTLAPFTLRALREQIEHIGTFDLFDLGGCGCGL